ncbi:MAG: hypothetical protein JO063_09465 [Pseudonocardiales bacterium]|nr:hypothetical protein [Pseudonocardiales bacterium]
MPTYVLCWLLFPPPNNPPEPWPACSPRGEPDSEALPDWYEVFAAAACATL